jgi:hypothetical protein
MGRATSACFYPRISRRRVQLSVSLYRSSSRCLQQRTPNWRAFSRRDQQHPASSPDAAFRTAPYARGGALHGAAALASFFRGVRNKRLLILRTLFSATTDETLFCLRSSCPLPIQRTTGRFWPSAGYPANGGAIDDRSGRAVAGAARKFRGSNTVPL